MDIAHAVVSFSNISKQSKQIREFMLGNGFTKNSLVYGAWNKSFVNDQAANDFLSVLRKKINHDVSVKFFTITEECARKAQTI
jgi:CRISPR/Cas system-associated protein endoribonuclease Cas2